MSLQEWQHILDSVSWENLYINIWLWSVFAWLQWIFLSSDCPNNRGYFWIPYLCMKRLILVANYSQIFWFSSFLSEDISMAFYEELLVCSGIIDFCLINIIFINLWTNSFPICIAKVGKYVNYKYVAHQSIVRNRTILRFRHDNSVSRTLHDVNFLLLRRFSYLFDMVLLFPESMGLL